NSIAAIRRSSGPLISTVQGMALATPDRISLPPSVLLSRTSTPSFIAGVLTSIALLRRFGNLGRFGKLHRFHRQRRARRAASGNHGFGQVGTVLVKVREHRTEF